MYGVSTLLVLWGFLGVNIVKCFWCLSLPMLSSCTTATLSSGDSDSQAAPGENRTAVGLVLFGYLCQGESSVTWFRSLF